jgi:hypothetical protein
MKTNRLPPGWDRSRVERLLAHYEGQADEEAVTEDEAAGEFPGRTMIEVPTDLVPVVRELIAKRHP